MCPEKEQCGARKICQYLGCSNSSERAKTFRSTDLAA